MMSKQQKWIHINLNDEKNFLKNQQVCAGYIIDDFENDSRTIFQDIQNLCDSLLPIYQKSDFNIGFVVAPIELFSRSGDFKRINRPNFMISLPVSESGLAAGRNLLFDGVNVLYKTYSLLQYEKAMKLYLRAVEDRDIHFRSLKAVTSIISFDVAAIDSAVNQRLQALGSEQNSLQNKAAIAIIKLAHRKFVRYFSGESWSWLADHGARPQHIMADVSGVSNPQHYIDELSAHTELVGLSANQFADDRLYINTGKDNTAIVGDAGYVVHDVGDLGIHLDELGEKLVNDSLDSLV